MRFILKYTFIAILSCKTVFAFAVVGVIFRVHLALTM